MTEPAEGTVFTPNLNLAKQPTGAENWGEVLNENFDKLDSGVTSAIENSKTKITYWE